MHESVHVSMSKCIIHVCMHLHMYGGKNAYVFRQTCLCLNMYMYLSIYAGRHA